jgi:YhcH/YjgK/YiaL family protein
MKNLFFTIMAVTIFLGLFGCKGSDDPAKWSDKQIDKWFEKGDWLNGWQVTPDATTDRKTMAISYFKHKDRWDKAFRYLKETDLKSSGLERQDIDGDNLYALPSEYMSKNEEDARFEAHEKYADIQYVISGKELIGVAPMSELKEITEPYDPARDIVFMTVNNFKDCPANPDKVFIFFPDDIHRPGLKDGDNSPIRKVVMKVRLD